MIGWIESIIISLVGLVVLMVMIFDGIADGGLDLEIIVDFDW